MKKSKWIILVLIFIIILLIAYVFCLRKQVATKNEPEENLISSNEVSDEKIISDISYITIEVLDKNSTEGIEYTEPITIEDFDIISKIENIIDGATEHEFNGAFGLEPNAILNIYTKENENFIIYPSDNFEMDGEKPGNYITIENNLDKKNYEIDEELGEYLKQLYEENISLKETAKTNLTNQELKEFTDFLMQAENNGFLLSDYNDAANANLSEIFYSGASIETDDNAIEEYISVTGNEVDVELTKVTTEQIKSFMKQKTGKDIKDLSSIENYFTYLKQYDAYYLLHGDTNIILVEAKSGYKTDDDKYIVEYKGKAGYDQAISGGTVTLKKSGKDYLFLSNKTY